MQDQVVSFRSKGMRAAYLSSSLSGKERTQVRPYVCGALLTVVSSGGASEWQAV